MKMTIGKTCFISVILMMAASLYAGESSMRPQSSVPTPAERSEISKRTPDLGAKERENWQRLRDERRAAREEILSNLKSTTSAEKRNIRREVAKAREKPRVDGDRVAKARERQPAFENNNQSQVQPIQGLPPGFVPYGYIPTGPTGVYPSAQ